MKQNKFNSRSFAILVVFLLFLAPHSDLRAQSADVPLYHSVYPFLERLVNFMPNHALDLHVIPISRDRVRQILQSAKASSLVLSHADGALLGQYLAEFSDPAPGEAKHKSAERNFVRYQEERAQLFLDLYGIQRFEIRRGDFDKDESEVSRTQAGIRMRAHLPPRLLIATDFNNTLERGTADTTERFDPDTGLPVSLSGSSAFRAGSIGYARLDLRWLELEAGRNYFSWNVSPLNQLALNQRNEPFDLVRLDARWKKFRFIFAHGWLRSNAQKYVAAHRLEAIFFSKLLLAVGETVIYGNRGPEFQYLNPFMLYHAAEQLLGDRDNNVVTFDFAYFLGRGVKLYGELFIDDLSLEFPIGTYFGNKLAYLAGVYWVQPFGWRTGDLRLEWARVDPYVYTHDDSVNIYEQNSIGLGASFGPNADRYVVATGWQPHRDLRFDAQLSFRRKGQGDLFTPHSPEDGDAKGFLSGTIIKTWGMNLKVEDQIYRDIYVGLEFDWQRDSNTDFITGKRATRRVAVFSLRLDI